MTTTHHPGSCHWGPVRYEVDLDRDKPAIQCNCSMCSRTGSLLLFVPAGTFQLLQGEDNLADYQFNKQVIHHVFCKTCGVRSFARGRNADGKDMVAINMRCLEGFELADTKIQNFDGRSR